MNNAVNVVVRELVSNVLIHRDFLDATGTQILLYKDRIEVINPNNPKTYDNVNMNEFEPFSKNPVIAKTFRKIGYADELGSGFGKIENACANYFKSTPVVEDKEVFKVIVYLKSDSDYAKQDGEDKSIILDYINRNGSINSRTAREKLHCEKTWAVKILSELVDSGLIKREGKSVSTVYKSVH